MVHYPLTYFGYDTLSQALAEQLISIAQNTLHCKPSFLITQLHYEGLWGRSEVAQLNNNWGGMTWSDGWSSPHNRESGVTVTKGSPRPANEGGHYIKYTSVNDFIIDWSYLLRPGGGYNIANTTTFNNAVKGLFVVGGADYDYATMNVEGSQLRYELYLNNISARRTEINNDNNQALDEIDNQTPEPDPDPDPVPSGLKSFINQLIGSVYYFDQKKTFGNTYIKGEKRLDNMFALQVTNTFIDKLNAFLNNGGGTDPIPDPDPEPFPPVSNYTNITAVYGYSDDYDGWHAGLDFGGIVAGVDGDPIYATMDGTVEIAEFNNGGLGNVVWIKHEKDTYFSAYAHLSDFNTTVGSTVKKGDVIGYMGNTGFSFGTHLHFVVATVLWGNNESNTIDPEIYLGI